MHMNPMIGVGGENSLLSILINLAFGFVAGLMVFIGFSEVLAFGTTLAEQLLALSGYGQQMAAFGIATTAAPYVILAPIAGMVVKQLAGVRSLKSFAFFAAAVLVGVAAAYFSQGYIVSLIEAA
jgi:hypothetical protein